jgi:hypothetical protein
MIKNENNLDQTGNTLGFIFLSEHKLRWTPMKIKSPKKYRKYLWPCVSIICSTAVNKTNIGDGLTHIDGQAGVGLICNRIAIQIKLKINTMKNEGNGRIVVEVGNVHNTQVLQIRTVLRIGANISLSLRINLVDKVYDHILK